MIREKNRVSPGARFLGAVLALSLILAWLTGIIRLFAGSAGFMEAEMRRFAPPERTGLPEAEYPAMAAHIADYLAGRTDSFQYILDAGGVSRACFHDYELLHMADCRGLIRLDGMLCLGALLAAVLSGILLLRGSRARFSAARSGARTAVGLLCLLAAALTLWALFSFDGLFLTFHRLAFRNDLWLLNPRTDLLIRLMPEEMFMDMGLKGLIVFLAGLTAGWLISRLLLRKAEGKVPR